MHRNLALAVVAAFGLTGCDQPWSSPVSARFAVQNPFAPPPAFPGSETAQGSGCKFPGDTLPDGAWFGFVSRMDADALMLDVACYYLNDAALKQASLKGEEPPPNLFFVVNDEKRLVRVPVALNAVAYKLIDVPGAIAPLKTTYTDFRLKPGRYMPCPAEWCTVWVYINGGVATEVQSQYFP